MDRRGPPGKVSNIIFGTICLVFVLGLASMPAIVLLSLVGLIH